MGFCGRALVALALLGLIGVSSCCCVGGGTDDSLDTEIVTPTGGDETQD